MAGRSDQSTRLPSHSSRRALRRCDRRLRQPHSGYLLRAPQPKDPPFMSVIELETREVAIETPSTGLWADAWYRLRRNPGAITGFVIIVAIIFIALFAPLLAPSDPR